MSSIPLLKVFQAEFKPSKGGKHSPNPCLPLRLRLRHRPRLILVQLALLIALLYIFGVFTWFLERDFATQFAYPLYSPRFRELIEGVRSGHVTGWSPVYNHTAHFVLDPVDKCSDGARNDSASVVRFPITLLIVVKSAACNYELRTAIRQTWGFESRFADVTIRTVFLLGRCASTHCDVPRDFTSTHLSNSGKQFLDLIRLRNPVSCEAVVELEHSKFGDLIQADFVDSYYNNTKKTMAGLQWTATRCNQIPFIFFVDDDYYVSVKNLLKFTRDYLHTDSVEDDDDEDHPRVSFDGRLYAGFVFPHSKPMRHLPSKWYISLAQYPYDRYPPYVTGGCYLVNNRTISDLYYASLYTKPFLYDDVYLGILAYKMKIRLIEANRWMKFDKLPYEPKRYGELIASHGYKSPQELIRVWMEQKELGFA